MPHTRSDQPQPSSAGPRLAGAVAYAAMGDARRPRCRDRRPRTVAGPGPAGDQAGTDHPPRHLSTATAHGDRRRSVSGRRSRRGPDPTIHGVFGDPERITAKRSL